MYKNTADAALAFRNNIAFKGPNSRVVITEKDGFPIVTIFSYDLKIGEKSGDCLKGRICILPIPGKGATLEQGGSKTTRSLVSALWGQYPNAKKLS